MGKNIVSGLALLLGLSGNVEAGERKDEILFKMWK